MLSERSYWIVLIAAIGTVIGIDLVLVLPFITLSNFGIGVLTSSVFALFTIIFLNWGRTLAEEKRWRIVGTKVKERINYRVQKIRGDVSAYFLEPELGLSDDANNSSKKDKVTHAEKEKTALVNSAESHASQADLKLGQFATALLKEPDKDIVSYLIEDFRRESDFLEHIISEYSDFLPPKSVHSLMEIEDGIDDLVDTLWIVSMPKLTANRATETMLQDAILKITNGASQFQTESKQ